MNDNESEYESDIESEEEEMKWNWIEGYKNLYAIYEDGTVYGMKSKIFLKQWLDNNGYLFVSLFKNGKNKRHRIHRLVAQYFIPNPQNKPFVDHINGIKTDNRIENLRWASYTENNRNAKLSSNNKSGEKNVYWSRVNNRWIVNFGLNGKTKYFGSFINLDDAVAFAKFKRAELHGEFANYN